MRRQRAMAPRWLARTVLAAGSALGVGLLAVLLVPPLLSAREATVVAQPATFSIGSAAQITPDTGWSVQPVAGDGVLVKSPDRVLSVTLQLATPATELLGSTSVETLADGAQLTHVTSAEHVDALLQLQGTSTELLVAAQVSPSAHLTDYRAELAQLLLRITPTD